MRHYSEAWKWAKSLLLSFWISWLLHRQKSSICERTTEFNPWGAQQHWLNSSINATNIYCMLISGLEQRQTSGQHPSWKMPSFRSLVRNKNKELCKFCAPNIMEKEKGSSSMRTLAWLCCSLKQGCPESLVWFVWLSKVTKLRGYIWEKVTSKCSSRAKVFSWVWVCQIKNPKASMTGTD